MKTSNGFTLMEVMLAMGVLTMSIFVISEIMLRSLLRIQTNQDNLEKVFLIKREFYLNFIKIPFNEKKVVTKLEDPAITFATTIVDIGNKSSLKEYKDLLKIIQTNATWKIENRIKESNMMGFVFKPKEKEAKK